MSGVFRSLLCIHRLEVPLEGWAVKDWEHGMPIGEERLDKFLSRGLGWKSERSVGVSQIDVVLNSIRGRRFVQRKDFVKVDAQVLGDVKTALEKFLHVRSE